MRLVALPCGPLEVPLLVADSPAHANDVRACTPVVRPTQLRRTLILQGRLPRVDSAKRRSRTMAKMRDVVLPGNLLSRVIFTEVISSEPVILAMLIPVCLKSSLGVDNRSKTLLSAGYAVSVMSPISTNGHYRSSKYRACHCLTSDIFQLPTSLNYHRVC